FNHTDNITFSSNTSDKENSNLGEPSKDHAGIHLNEFTQFIVEYIGSENKEDFEVAVFFDNEETLNSLDQISKRLREELSDGDGYKWIQSSVLNDFKNSNRKRMIRYDCNGQLIIHINKLLKRAHIQVKHSFLHDHPSLSAEVSTEILEEIKENCHLDPLQLRSHLSVHFDLKDITAKQIYYWWSKSNQAKYQKHKDPVQSAIILLQEIYTEKGCKLLMSTASTTLTTIAFTTPNLNVLLKVKEIHIDATYKTAKGSFELYGIIGQYQGSANLENRLMYNEFHRNQDYPFWTREYQYNASKPDSSGQGSTIQEIYSDNDKDSDISKGELEVILQKVERLVQHTREEHTHGNTKHVKALLKGLKRACDMMEDIDKSQRKRIRERTWEDAKPHTLYLN
ncbi:9719_t:CDS:2, partial [Ambispora gerdemannii]